MTRNAIWNDLPLPAFGTLLWRGFRRTCPRCGKSDIFSHFLRLKDCENCGQPLKQIRADDFPPYLTMFVVGHVVVPLLLITERTMQPSVWVHLSIWLPLSAFMIYFLLPRFKGLVVGWMMHLGLHGYETQ